MANKLFISGIAQIDVSNHSSALKRPDFIDDYIKTELQNTAIIGTFQSNPFSSECVVSPLQVVTKDSTSKPRIVHDLSFPERFSVNDGISNNTFLNDSFELRTSTGGRRQTYCVYQRERQRLSHFQN